MMDSVTNLETGGHGPTISGQSKNSLLMEADRFGFGLGLAEGWLSGSGCSNGDRFVVKAHTYPDTLKADGIAISPETPVPDRQCESMNDNIVAQPLMLRE